MLTDDIFLQQVKNSHLVESGYLDVQDDMSNPIYEDITVLDSDCDSAVSVN